MPKVSIIVPVYNVENYIEKCLDSLINQTLENIEIILVNDGSTDNSKEKIEKYLKSGKAVGTTGGAMSGTSAIGGQGGSRFVTNVVSTNSAQVSNQTSHTINTKPKSQATSKTKSFSKNSEEYWPQIMDDLRQNGKIVLYTNLKGSKAKELNDMTVGIEFPNGMTSFGKAVLEKQENIRELSNLVSIACGKEMQIKYLTQTVGTNQPITKEENLQNFANESDIPFNIIE